MKTQGVVFTDSIYSASYTLVIYHYKTVLESSSGHVRPLQYLLSKSLCVAPVPAQVVVGACHVTAPYRWLPHCALSHTSPHTHVRIFIDGTVDVSRSSTHIRIRGKPAHESPLQYPFRREDATSRLAPLDVPRSETYAEKANHR